MLHGMKTVLFVLLLSLGMTLTHANIATHTYEVEKGWVTYDVYGGGALTPETNLTLRGQAILKFKDKGTTLLYHEKGIVQILGALKGKQKIESLEKQTDEALYTVDFENESIQEHKNSIANTIKQQDTKNLKKTGEDRVAGLQCDTWEGNGIKLCLHKGIVLKAESEILGISYHKVAVSVDFDIDTSEEAFALPDFPMENFALFHSTLKTKMNRNAKCFTDVLKDVAETIEKKVIKHDHHYGIGQKEKTALLNKIGQKIYAYQKKILPELLYSMRVSRECLQLAETVPMANECMSETRRIKEELGSDENTFILLWDDTIKAEVLDKLEDDITYLQSRMPCIERSKNITDLSACMS